MTSYFSKKEIEDMKPNVDKTVEKVVGFSEPSLVTTTMNCLLSGYDKKKTGEKLSSLLDSSVATKLANRIFDMLEDSRPSRHKKRHHDSHHDSEIESEKKKSRTDKDNNNAPPAAVNPNNPLSAIQIKDMMANAQKMIEERKKALNAFKNDTDRKGLQPPSVSVQRTEEKAKKIAQLQAQIQSKLSTGVLGRQAPKPAVSDKPTPLILDSQGRTVDVTGKEIQLTHLVPTLKANIRAKKREEFRQQLQEKSVEDISESHFFDPRISMRSNVRNKRPLRFHEPGKFQQMADRMRMKAQLEKLQNEISQIARKTGITSATKLALIAPKVETQVEEIPNVEWWDSVVLTNDSYVEDEEGKIPLKESAITNLVEHPIQVRPPSEPLKPAYMPVFLTKKERKKLRRQNRREAWKEEQEKIRLGLEPPPEPKLRISNLMRVLGTEAVQDPTKIEAHVKAQMAKRQKAHEEANASRRLTDEQRREKRVRKLQEDTSLGVVVSVYRVRELTNSSKRFKVEMNAKQLYMTGCVVLFKDCNVVVVEGGVKQQGKYKRLMLHRIKWEEDALKNPSEKAKNNQCVLIWEGVVVQRTFNDFKFKACATEKLARDHFKKHGVEHYWDLAYSASVLETTEEK